MMRRSRRVFEPQAAPLCATFEDAGVAGALARLRDALAIGSTRALLSRVPPWVWSLNFLDAVQGCARCDAVGALVDAMRAEARALTGDSPMEDRAGGRPADALPTNVGPSSDSRGTSSQSPTHTAALVRLCFGELLEAVAVQQALVASERVAEWVQAAKVGREGKDDAGALTALKRLVEQVTESPVYAEEAVLANADEELKPLVQPHESVVSVAPFFSLPPSSSHSAILLSLSLARARDRAA